jgi:putative intracellular protease/amidase
VEIAILAYENMTALDAMGPYEVLSRLPETRLRFVAERRGLVTTDTGMLRIDAEAAIDEVEQADVVLVPGGPGDEALRANPRVLGWLRARHEDSQVTASVCTGSLILAAAGILDGLPATTHWGRMETLAELGAKPEKARWVESGKVWTAAGVSAGIDMALALTAKLVNETWAKGIQLGIEYDPAPPFQAGSPEAAGDELVALVRSVNG